jgi:hypothetical protein
MTKFFSKDFKGLNTDIKRHRIKIEKMNNMITKLEQIHNKTELDESLLFSYKNMLHILIQSNVTLCLKNQSLM